MLITVTGKQIDVGDALRRHAETVIGDIAEKYFGTAIEAHVVFSREAHLIHCDLQVHVGRGIEARSGDEAGDAYAAFDGAAERVGKRLRRYKRRLRDYHIAAKEHAREEELARAYVLRPHDEEEAGAVAAGAPEPLPIVIAEMESPIPQLSVSEAVMRLDLADLPALVFKNGARGTLNVIYRRRDGNIGWIDPTLPRQRSRRANS